MTNEEAIEELKRDIHNAKVTHHISEHYEMAIKALEKKPCEDCINFPKGTLKKRGKGYVAYNYAWLKKNWQTELKAMGIDWKEQE